MNAEYAARLAASAQALGVWAGLPFFQNGEFARLCARLAKEEGELLPAPERVFAALQRTPLERVRVVILGQDPYPTPGHANGLAFSVAPEIAPLPRSLSNIFKEMEADLERRPENGDLGAWADRGVLLLNSALSVRAGAAGAHAKLGWAPLIEQIIQVVAARDRVVWLLWGGHARARRELIEAGCARERLIIESAHPSPLSASRGFFGSRPFSRANAYLGEEVF